MVGSKVLGHHHSHVRPGPELAQEILQRFQSTSRRSNGQHVLKLGCHAALFLKRRARSEFALFNNSCRFINKAQDRDERR
jgi:hypothetical protein